MQSSTRFVASPTPKLKIFKRNLMKIYARFFLFFYTESLRPCALRASSPTSFSETVQNF